MLQRRPYLLLEVLIAFFLVALCILPLMHPQIAMLKEQSTFIHDLDLDRTVDRLYADLLVKFYHGDITWAAIGDKNGPGVVEPIVDKELESLGYAGTYAINVVRWANGHYANKDEDENKVPHEHLLEARYVFTRKGEKPVTYSYWLHASTTKDQAAPVTPTPSKTKA